MSVADAPSVVEQYPNEVYPEQRGPEATTVESGPIGQNQMWIRPDRNRGITLLNF